MEENYRICIHDGMRVRMYLYVRFEPAALLFLFSFYGIGILYLHIITIVLRCSYFVRITETTFIDFLKALEKYSKGAAYSIISHIEVCAVTYRCKYLADT